MPRRAERHASSGDRWSSQPSRSAELTAAASADPEPPPRPPSRKDTRSWCRGRTGVSHSPRIEFRPPVFRSDLRLTCRWEPDWLGDDIRWECYHQEECKSCGKILLHRIAAERCPGWPGSDEQKDAATKYAAEVRDQRPVRRVRIITGPQGYRRRRDR